MNDCRNFIPEKISLSFFSDTYVLSRWSRSVDRLLLRPYTLRNNLTSFALSLKAHRESSAQSSLLNAPSGVARAKGLLLILICSKLTVYVYTYRFTK